MSTLPPLIKDDFPGFPDKAPKNILPDAPVWNMIGKPADSVMGNPMTGLHWEDVSPERIHGYISNPKTTLFIIERNPTKPYRGRMTGAIIPDDEETPDGLLGNALITWLKPRAAQYLREFEEMIIARRTTGEAAPVATTNAQAEMDRKQALCRSLLGLIGGRIDEDRLVDDPDSFVEMDKQVIHVASTKYGTRYFRVTLTEVTEGDYDEPIQPS